MKSFGLFLLSVALVSCSAFPLKKTQATQSILKCSKGNLTGTQDFVDLFRTLSDHCTSLRDTKKNFYACLMENLGITEEDGTPNLSKMGEFFKTIFSELVLQDIPDFENELTECGKTYVSDFNGIHEAPDSAEAFFKCFTDTVQNFSETIEKVCKLEQQFNGHYFISP